MPDQKSRGYQTMVEKCDLNRRNFLKVSSAASAGLVLGTPTLWAQDKQQQKKTERIKTNIDDLNHIFQP